MLCWVIDVQFVFFFKQKTAYEMRISDWSSDVCSSDLGETDQHEADIVDRRISEQALDVLLPDRADRAENARGERQEDDDLLPRRDRRTPGAHRIDPDAHQTRNRRDLPCPCEDGRNRHWSAFIDLRGPTRDSPGPALAAQAPTGSPKG